jgi:hypothetical protein
MFLVLWAGLAFSSEFSEEIQKARVSFIAKEDLKMAKHLALAKKSASSLQEIVRPDELAFIFYISGLAAARRGEEALDYWRKTFTLYLEYEGEADLFESKEQADLFYAVRMEKEYAEQKTAFVPPKIGLAKLFVDGVERSHGDTIPVGEHLIQIQCPKGEILSQWHTLEIDPLWLTMCPYEIDLNEVVSDDPFSLNMLDDSTDDSSSASLASDKQESVEENAKVGDEVEESKKEKNIQDMKVRARIRNDPKEKKGHSYFSGLTVKKIGAEEYVWFGLGGGVSIDAKSTPFYHGSVSALYHDKDWEFEGQLGTDCSIGVNLIPIKHLSVGLQGGFSFSLEEDLFVDIRVRRDFRWNDSVLGYARVRTGYQISFKRLYSGVDVGLLFPLF